MTSPPLLLLHGLYMHQVVMQPLANKLKVLGWAPNSLSYNSLKIEPEILFARLCELLPDEEPAFLVGHSLGGVLLQRFAEQHPLPAGSRIVTLGSPLQGALIAQRVVELGLEKAMGNAGKHGLLPDGPRQWAGSAELGSLAGNGGMGLGQIIARPAKGIEHDGTVLVEETRLPGMADHLVLPVNHTSMLLSTDVAGQVDHFLRHGRFNHNIYDSEAG